MGSRLPSTAPPRAPLDPVVKIGLTVLIGGFALIAAGMFLSRPDRTIPPYSIGAQDGVVVAVHVPPSTSDPAIATLLRRFRDVGVTAGDFRSMKVRPTTPDDPRALYRHVILYVFSDPDRTRPDVLHRYLTGQAGDGTDDDGTVSDPATAATEVGDTTDDGDAAFRQAWRRAARGGFLYTRGRAKGWLGPIPDPDSAPDTARPGRRRSMRVLFDDGAVFPRPPSPAPHPDRPPSP